MGKQDEHAYDSASHNALKRELNELIGKVNTDALAARARHLRHGVPCSIPALRDGDVVDKSLMGGMNYHVEILFDDGVTWLARIRRYNTSCPPPKIRDYMIQSEVATLRFLEKTKVPVPKVYDFALEHHSHSIGVGYILMEKLPGKPLSWSSEMTHQQKHWIMSQVADILIELRKYEFNSMGSLDGQSELHVGPFAHESMHGLNAQAAGPFQTVQECRHAELQMVLRAIARDEMYVQQPVDAYLVHRFLLDVLSHLLPPRNGIFLKHADDKGDHIMVDDDYNITGIVDWEWAYTTSAALAFKSPQAFLPVADFYNGSTDIGDDERSFASILEAKGSTELAQCVRNGRLQHFYEFCSQYTFSWDWDGFQGLFRGLRDALRIDAGLDWESWKKVALDRYSDDKDLQLVMSKSRKD
ncbi:MAG: hypothetical protein Q9159_005535 [Coniocarpon cinnabarinum]